MIRIGICDDEELIGNQLRKKIERCMGKVEDKVEYCFFTSGEELLNNEKELDLLFLDIDMPEMDGIDTGKRFREKNKICKIIMATGRVDRMREAFFLEAYRFLVKPFEDEEIEEVVESYWKSRVGFQKIQLSENRQMVQIMQYQIFYIQAYDSYTEYVLENRVLRSERSLDRAMQELDQCIFVRVDRKNIVNLKYVDTYKNGELWIGNKSFTVSRRRKKGFERQYREFDLNYR